MSNDTKPAHTPEPWEIADPDARRLWIVEAASGETVLSPCDDRGFIDLHNEPAPRTRKETRANAVRAVACVNACAGIPDPAAAIRQAREALTLTLETVAGDGCAPSQASADRMLGALHAALAALGG